MNNKGNKTELVNQFLTNYADRTKQLFEKGSMLTANYMACLTGMWTHALHRPMESPFNSKEEGDLYSYFFTGYYASVDARGINEKERKERLELDKKRQKDDPKKYKQQLIKEKMNKNAGGYIESFWKKKLF
jgi:hypothetical protein